jgi:glycine hydroxymethyltransferase
VCGKNYQVGQKAEQTIGKAVDMAVFPGQQGGPLVHIIAAKAVAFGEVLRPEFKMYAAQIVANAKALASALTEAGYRLVSGGTDNHLLLVDVFEKGILGSEAELALGKAGITVNKNAIPYDTNPPLKPSGIRIGTPALTTRGMRETEMRQIGDWIAKALEQHNDDAALERIRNEVAELANQFPLYAWRRIPAAVHA